MNKPYYTAAAIADLEDTLAFIAKDKPTAAVSWVDRIEAKCLQIAENPQTGEQMPSLGLEVRVSPIGRYMVFHRYVNGRLEILRVIPGGADVSEL